MNADVRHMVIIAGREIGELWRERAMMIVTALFTFGFPIYLGFLAAVMNIRPDHLLIWALDCAMMPIFPAAMMMVHTFIAERDQGILPTLLATPVSNFSLFSGKTLPILVLGVAQGIGAYLIFAGIILLRNPEVLYRADHFALMTLPFAVVCTTLLTDGVGVIIASRVRSARTAGLALTFTVIFILLIESGLTLWLMTSQLGHRLTPDAIISQLALGAATMMIAANTYRREQIVSQL